MKYQKLNFVIHPSGDTTSVECGKRDVLSWAPLCSATFWLMNEPRDCIQDKSGVTVNVYPNNPCHSDVLAQYIQYSCARCKFNKINDKNR